MVIYVCVCEAIITLCVQSYNMVCPSVRGDNPGGFASRSSPVQVHVINISSHLHLCRPCTLTDIGIDSITEQNRTEL